MALPCSGIDDPRMRDEDAQALAERFRALADPTRVRIVNLLSRLGELCVCDLQSHVELAQPTVSHHLAVLRRAGLIEAETRGRWAYYSAKQGAICELAEALDVTVCTTTA